MKLWYCENYVSPSYFTGREPLIEQFYILETEFGSLIEYNEEGKRIFSWDDWRDFFSTWKSQAVREKDFIKVRVL